MLQKWNCVFFPWSKNNILFYNISSLLCLLIYQTERSLLFPDECSSVLNSLHLVVYICTSSYLVMDDSKCTTLVGIIDRTANPKSFSTALGGISSAEILYLDEDGPSRGQMEEQQKQQQCKRWWLDVIYCWNEAQRSTLASGHVWKAAIILNRMNKINSALLLLCTCTFLCILTSAPKCYSWCFFFAPSCSI